MTSAEAECELVEVGVEVLGSDRAMVGAEHPALEQARNAMHARQQDVGGIVLAAHDGPLVLVAAVGHVPVRLPPVGVHGRTRLHRALDKRDQAVLLRDIVHVLQPNPPETLGVLDLDRDRNDRLLAVCRPPTPASTPPTYVSSTSTKPVSLSRRGRTIGVR